MKQFLIAGFWLCCTWAAAAFDLQFVSRYSSSAICHTSFSFIVSTPEGYAVAGRVGEDIVIAKFDAYGGLLASQLWDSPLVKNDSPRSFVRADDGSFYVVVESQSYGVYVLKYNSSLALQWEREVVPGESFQMRADTSTADGRTYLVTHLPDSNRIRMYYWVSDGTQGTVVNQNGLPTGYFMADLQAFNVAAGGYVVGGRRNDHEFFTRRNSLGTTLYDTTLGGTANSQNTVTSLFALADFTVVGVGQGYNGGYQSAIYSVSSSGVVARTLRPEGETLDQLRRIGTNLYQARLRVPSGVTSSYEAVRFNATNRVFTKRFASDGFMDNHFAPDGLGEAWLFDKNTDTGSTYANFWDANTQTQNGSASTNSQSPKDIIDIPGGAAVAGFRSQGDYVTGSIQHVVDERVDEVAVNFAGGARRSPVDRSATGTDGAITTLSNESSGFAEKAVVTRYRSDGTLAFARTVQIPVSAYFSPVAIAVGPSGESVVLGQDVNTGSMSWAKLNAAGTIEFTKSLIVFPGANPVRAAIGADGSIYLAGLGFRGSDARSWLAKMNPAGGLVYLQEYNVVNASTGYSVAMELVVTPSRVYLGSFANDAGGGVYRVRQINASTGASQDSYAGTTLTGTRMALATDGNLLVIGTRAGDVHVVKLSATGVSSELASRTFAGAPASSRVAIASSPNGNAALLREQGTVELTLLDANLNQLTTTTVEPTVTVIKDVVCDPSNNIYVLGEEESANSTVNTYAAKYLSSGVRSAQRRTAGYAQNLGLLPSGGVWISGRVGTRKKGWGPFVAKYTN